MFDGIEFILAFVLSVGACVMFWGRIRNASGIGARIFAIFRFVTSIALAILFCWGFIASNNLLWYGQHKENAHIEININKNNVEKTSFIYLLEELDATTTVDDVIAIMGSNFEESNDGEYRMTYKTSRYTINGMKSSFISFVFNYRKTAILQITWAYKDPSSNQFSQILQYLEGNAFGKADSYSSNKADWPGLHIEDTSYYLLVQRVY